MIRPLAHLATRLILFGENLRRSGSAVTLTAIRSLLIVETTRMGDVLVLIPLLNSFHRANPEARITLAVNRNYGDILNCVKSIGEVIALDGTERGTGFRKALKSIRAQSFDLAVSASPSYRNALLTLSSRSPLKVGYFVGACSMAPFLDRITPEAVGFTVQQSGSYHMANIYERPARIAGLLGLPMIKDPSTIDVQRRHRDEADRVLERNRIGEEPYVVIHPFSGWTYRAWEPSRFVWVGRELARTGVRSLFIGGVEDKERLRSFIPESDPDMIGVVGEPIGTIMGLMVRARLFIGNDSGPLHLAAAVGLPSIGLFGPASPDLTGANDDTGRYFYQKVECSPCAQLRCVRPHDPCINLIHPEEVLAAARAMLAKTRQDKL